MKRIVLLLLVIFLSINLFAQRTAVVFVESAEIRAQPSKTSEIIRKVKQGESINIISRKHRNGWYRASMSEGDFFSGWIRGDSIIIVSTGWIYFFNSSDNEYHYDLSRFSRTGAIVQVWVRGTSKTSDEKTSMILYEVNCSQPLVRSLAGVEYKDGKSINSWDTPQAKFRRIIPETVGESLKKAVCKLD